MSRIEPGALVAPCACPGERWQRRAALRLFVHLARQTRLSEGRPVRPSDASAGELRREFTLFVALTLALILTQRTGGSGSFGATIWILARIVYLPVYMFGIMYVRTAVWAISIVGIVMMLGRLILG
jgi:uncharacterized MAPEG superfamily protein